MSARVKHFLSALLHALKEERHFALLDGVAFSNRRLARNRFQARTQSDPCISSVATAIMITTSNSSLGVPAVAGFHWNLPTAPAPDSSPTACPS